MNAEQLKQIEKAVREVELAKHGEVRICVKDGYVYRIDKLETKILDR